MKNDTNKQGSSSSTPVNNVGKSERHLVKITHVAIRFDGATYSLPSPNRHHDVIRLIAETLSIKYVDTHDEDQGFLDEKGNYWNRKQALRLVEQNGQLRKDREVIGRWLYSENLW